MPAAKTKSDEKPQFERSLETAREVGADETDEALDRALKKSRLLSTPLPLKRIRIEVEVFL